MSNTTHISSSATSATAAATSTAATYDFSIEEATVRNTAIGVCIALFVLLFCALIALEIMRRRLKRMRKWLRKYMSQEEGLSTHYVVGSGLSIQTESPANPEDIRYELVRPMARLPERHVADEFSVQGEVFESDARSVHSFHRGSTHKHNKNVVSKWYDLRGHRNRQA